MTIALQAAQLALGYGNQKNKIGNVIAEVNLSLTAGQVLVIQGPNGSGKSTLMKGLARQLKPAAGTISLDGKNIWQMNIGEFARQVAYVPQSVELPWEMTVHELVSLGRNPHQKWWSTALSTSESALVAAAMSRCGLDGMGRRKVNELSEGEKQRATMAMALAQEPHFILLDEPTANLDFRYQLELIAIIKELKAQNIGVAAILHDLNLCARVADQVLLVGKSKHNAEKSAEISLQPAASSIVALGSVKEVLQPAQLRAVFDVDLTIVPDPDGDCDIYIPRSVIN